MKPFNLLACVIVGAALAGFEANAQQQRYQVQFRAQCVTTNEAGQIVNETITHNTFLAECVAAHGITNTNSLVLVFTLNGDFNGDVIEVVDKDTGAVVCQKLWLLYPMTLPNSDGSEVHQFSYVFNENEDQDVGTAIVRKKFSRKGKLKAQGTLTFHYAPHGADGLRLCRGSFTTSRPVNLGNLN